MTNKITSIIVLVILAAAGLYFYVTSQEKALTTLPREGCAETTEQELTVALIGPNSEVVRQDGKIFICPKIMAPEPESEEPETPNPTQTYKDLLKVSSPLSNQTTTSPIAITGEARGNWYFEASFVIKLIDEKGTEIGQTIATAESDWMTTEFVPFKAQLTITQNYIGPATLIFIKENPSGLPENNDEFRLPINLK